MLWVVCSFMLTTGQPTCTVPLGLNQAVKLAVSMNQAFPFDPKTSVRTPSTLYPDDQTPKGNQ